jgi:4-amino-4-deoxy-L-arabinose transferase-like glycosyltransferase
VPPNFKIKDGYLLFIFFILLYFILPNNNPGFDSYSYAISIKEGAELFHPHHLLYNLFGRLIYLIFGFTGLGSLKLLSLINSIPGAFTIVIIYKIISYTSGRFTALVGAAITGFIFSFWYYSTTLEVNLPALMFIMLALYYLLVKDRSWFNSIAVYLFLGAGILFHQITVLAIFPILIYDFLQTKSLTGTIRNAHPGLLLCLIIYLVIAINQAQTGSAAGVYRWLTYYSHLGAWGGIKLANFKEGIWGLTKTSFGGDIIRQIFFTGEWSIRSIVYLIVACLISAGFIWLAIIGIINMLKNRDSRQCLFLALVLIFALFAFWWAPADDGFWLYPIVLLIIFIFSAINKINKPVIALLILLALINVIFEFIPSSNKENSLTYQGAQVIKKLGLTENDLVLTNYNQIRLAMTYYYGYQPVFACLMFLEDGDKAEIVSRHLKRIDQTRQVGRVIIFENEFDPEPYRYFLFDRFSPEEYRDIYSRYLPYLTPVDSINVHGKWVRLMEMGGE